MLPSVERKLWEHLRRTLRSPGIPPFIGMAQEYPQLVFGKVTKKTATTKATQKLNVFLSPSESAGLNIYTKNENKGPKGCLRDLPSEK